MRGLAATDFNILDDGQPRSILDFRNDTSPVSVAILLDTSGSMRIAPKPELSAEMGRLLLTSLAEGIDAAGLFVFDKTVRIKQPFTTDFAPVRAALADVQPFGATSLYDAIAETSEQLSTRAGRRALIVITDGIDTSSERTAAEVSVAASTIDMPVYVLALGALAQDLAAEPAGKPQDASANLSDLARWSGGAFKAVKTPVEAGIAAKDIIAELRHQYLLAFEPHSSAGWHSIEIRAKRRLTLQARTGYWVGPRPAR
jgi:VWFA-related protein